MEPGNRNKHSHDRGRYHQRCSRGTGVHPHKCISFPIHPYPPPPRPSNKQTLTGLSAMSEAQTGTGLVKEGPHPDPKSGKSPICFRTPGTAPGVLGGCWGGSTPVYFSTPTLHPQPYPKGPDCWGWGPCRAELQALEEHESILQTLRQ